MTSDTMKPPSTLLQYLPAIYQDDPFIGQYLLAFEKVLLGPVNPGEFPSGEHDYPDRGLEEAIADLAALFDPQRTPAEFLGWLAGWVGFSLRADLTEQQQRDFTANIVQRYHKRGTKANLQELLALYTIGTPTIFEPAPESLQIGDHSQVGVDTTLGGGPPYYFHVTISLPRLDPKQQARQLEIARALIELEKPAHTYYEMEAIYPSMQIYDHSTIGVDTLLGSAIASPDI